MTISLKLYAIFILLFLDFGITIGPLKIPFFSSILTLLIIGTSLNSIKYSLTGGLLLFIFGCFGYFTSDSGASLSKVMSSIIQSTVSLLIFFSISQYSKHINNDIKIEKTSKILLLFTLLLLILERYGLTDSLSLQFARTVYSGEVGFKTYENIFSEERDIALAGFRRPTLFSPEPSIAAIGLSLLLIIRNLFATNFRSTIFNITLTIIVWFLIKSPIILLALVVIATKELVNRKKISSMLLYLPFALIFAGLLLSLIYSRYSSMVTQFSIEETSEGLRLMLPFIIVYESWTNLYILGTGPGSIYSEEFMMNLNPLKISIFGTNATALFFLYYGPIVGCFLIYLFVKAAFNINSILKIDKSLIYSILVLLFLANTLGTYEAPRLLGIFGFYMIFLQSAKKLGKI